ncbi:Gfo/Idh/MocA family oxidoreductase [Dehalococcoidia bacterium]|nr:Gfo/Idh/MocA family oxidoreductase [Dehalococcoidia bacterium]
MTGNTVRVGVIGVGFGAKVQIPGFQSEGIEVVAVCARRSQRAEKAARDFAIPGVYTDYRDMLQFANLDAVSIVTPPALHYEMAMAALGAGKHVLCEKPFAIDQAQALAMLLKAKETGLTAMITHEFRYAPARSYVKELLSEGYVGDVRNVHITLFSGPTENLGLQRMGWQSQASQGGGFLGAIGSHYIDCMRDWCGEITSVCGGVSLHDAERMNLETNLAARSDTDDAFCFLVTFKNGAWGAMSASLVAPFGPGVRIEIYGTNGTIHTPQPGGNPPPDGVVLGARLGDTQGITELPIPQRFHEFDDNRDERLMAFRILIRRFVQGINEHNSPSPNFYDGFRCQQILDAVRDSSVSRRWIDIPQG